MPKIKRTIKAEQEQEYMSRVAQCLFFRLNCIGYDREKSANSLALILLPVQHAKTTSHRI